MLLCKIKNVLPSIFMLYQHHFGSKCMILSIKTLVNGVLLCVFSLSLDDVVYYSLDEDKVCRSFAELLLRPADKVCIIVPTTTVILLLKRVLNAQ